ncbi:hypothetical protein EDC04DRAFT_2565756 [Pisolithus marmoratus]|nr:hypothetical protein EDC04DRAFT_2565756 [Pisolithus marmoratus]
MFTTLLLSLFSLVSSALAVPLPARDVVDPPITSPTASTVWNVGETQIVTWSTANLPTNITNPNGMLVLGYIANDSENLMLQSPLATNLNYSDGQAPVTVPNVPTGTNYIVVLFGDSGNASPQFTIKNGASSGTTTAMSSPAVTSTSPSSPSPTATASGGSPNSASAAGQSSAPLVTVTSTSTITVSASGASSSGSASTASQATGSSTQTNAAGSKYVPSLHCGLSVCLVLASLTFVM